MIYKRKFRQAFTLAILALFVGCLNPDPKVKVTKLPNNFVHFSNGGHQGFIGIENPKTGGIHRVYPDEDWSCDVFAVQGELVLCVCELNGKKKESIFDTKTGEPKEAGD